MTSPRISFSQKSQRTGEPPVSRLHSEAQADPGLISLAVGYVDEASLPVGETARAFADLLADRAAGQAALQYGTTPGLLPLRRKLLHHLEHLEGKPAGSMRLTEENVVVTTGSQQGLYLLADVLLDAGDLVIASAPSYFVYTGALQSFGADVRTVAMDGGGMRMDQLEALLRALAASGEIRRLKAIYVVSYYQNPTGLNLAADRRARLVELARAYSDDHRIVIIEDAAYRELRYDGPALGSVKSFDETNEYVALGMTFSKAFSPGMKTGYFFLPDDLLEAVLHQKGNHDFGSSHLLQHALLRVMDSGLYAEHASAVRQAYKIKRDTMLGALEEEFSETPATWTKPAGGLYVWVSLPETLDTRRGQALFDRCVDRGVLYVPGDYCFSVQEGRPPPTNYLRLSFGAVDVPTIREGIHRLAGAIRDSLPGARGRTLSTGKTA